MTTAERENMVRELAALSKRLSLLSFEVQRGITRDRVARADAIAHEVKAAVRV
ncbi:hypothetical protein [Stakelama tenebrarum]|uniref:Uncharacterized protein n=1 Tax=Stakelama tenebrarum TaxID=2711215 RepID=A0A6G6Y5U8_9SPHN|nr:hypothetical protein [Sphingosinithalassobacter tenebrarum]QIG80098.1 hypothetical protein G5C33_10105 [Sphingosinithalassobacter tenebrarum]